MAASSVVWFSKPLVTDDRLLTLPGTRLFTQKVREAASPLTVQYTMVR